MTDLERTAERWIREIHPHARHLVRARDWVVELDPGASEAARLAALLHDTERAFPDKESSWDSKYDWDDPAYLRWHQERSAAIAGRWLSEHRAPPDLVRCVQALIQVHEVGGFPEADLVQAADSLSFLEVLADLAAQWVSAGVQPARAEQKLRHMANRVNLDAARLHAQRLLVAALAARGADPS